ncbi:MAG: serine/threonine protein kinase [Polyangiaceae bacterium]|nr:serine/threonine protein kinase [Polyangiaceae bacterium]
MLESPCSGDLIDGKFRVERVLGKGGMGVVVSARHIELGEVFAIKLLHEARGGEAGAIERFRREARAAARLRGEHVARVSDVGTLADGTPYLVMEYVRGPTLAHLLRTEGPLPPAQAASYLLDACAGLAEAHAQGIIHRDVKPANLIVSTRPEGTPCVKVLDFGIAKTPSPGASTLTGTSAALGSPAYMSPEQVRDPRQVDPRADIWSLGVVFYELITGRLPFEAFTASGLLACIVSDPPLAPSRLVPGLPPEVELLLLACLEKDPSLRPQTVGELAARLGPIAGRDGSWVQQILERPDLRATADLPTPSPPSLDNQPTDAPNTLTRDPASAAPPPPARPALPRSLLRRPVTIAAASLLLLGVASTQLSRRGASTALQPLPSATEAAAPPQAAPPPRPSTTTEASSPASVNAPARAPEPPRSPAPPVLAAAPPGPPRPASSSRPGASVVPPAPPTSTAPRPATHGADTVGFGGRL